MKLLSQRTQSHFSWHGYLSVTASRPLITSFKEGRKLFFSTGFHRRVQDILEAQKYTIIFNSSTPSSSEPSKL